VNQRTASDLILNGATALGIGSELIDPEGLPVMQEQQIRELARRYLNGEVRVKRSRRHRFAPLYQHGDVALLVSVGAAHETLSGPATQKILQRPVL